MRLVIPRSTCVLFQDLHGRLLEVVQFLSASRIACANSGASAGQTAQFSSFLLCKGIAEKRHGRIIISHRKRPTSVRYDQRESKTWEVTRRKRYMIAQSSRTDNAGSRNVIPDLQSITWL
jgi:hypothetical protein